MKLSSDRELLWPMSQVSPPSHFRQYCKYSSDDLFVLKSTQNRHTVVCFLKSKEAELTQNLSPVGFGPSSNTWPICELQSAHLASTRAIPTTKTNASLSASSCTIALGSYRYVFIIHVVESVIFFYWRHIHHDFSKICMQTSFIKSTLLLS